jgi:hypothetical protein
LERIPDLPKPFRFVGRDPSKQVGPQNRVRNRVIAPVKNAFGIFPNPGDGFEMDGLGKSRNISVKIGKSIPEL